MNSYFSSMILEIAVLVLGLALLLLDLWTPADHKRFLGYGAGLALTVVLGYSFFRFDLSAAPGYSFGRSFVVDGLAISSNDSSCSRPSWCS